MTYQVMCFGKIKQEDIPAWEIFKAHENEYNLDIGELTERYKEAERMTNDLFTGTPYYVEVEEYCCMCTVSTLYKRVSTC